MIISMKVNATRDEVARVCGRIEEFGYKIHSIEGEERVVIGVVGMGDVTACLESLEGNGGRREGGAHFRALQVCQPGIPARTRREIRVAGVTFGGDEFVVMAGPCSVESEQQIHGIGRDRGALRREISARRRVQAAHFALRFSGSGSGRAEAAGQSAARDRPRDYHRSDERPRCGPGGRLCRHSADRRAQYAEFRAAEDAGQVRPSGAAEARA